MQLPYLLQSKENWTAFMKQCKYDGLHEQLSEQARKQESLLNQIRLYSIPEADNKLEKNLSNLDGSLLHSLQLDSPL